MYFILLVYTLILGSAPTLGCGIEDISRFISFSRDGEAGCLKLQCDGSNVWDVCGKVENVAVVCDVLKDNFKMTKCEWSTTTTPDWPLRDTITSLQRVKRTPPGPANVTTTERPTVPPTWSTSTTTTTTTRPTTTRRPTPRPSPWWPRILSFNNTFNIHNSNITIIIN